MVVDDHLFLVTKYFTLKQFNKFRYHPLYTHALGQSILILDTLTFEIFYYGSNKE